MELNEKSKIQDNKYKHQRNNKRIIMPKPHEEVLPGIKWGNYCQLYTPAFWKYLYISSLLKERKSEHHRLGCSIIEEVVACLLGGYGMPSEIGMSAYARLKDQGLIRKGVSYAEIYSALSLPFEISKDVIKRYRFANQKSRFIHKFLCREDLIEIPINDDLQLRKWLLTIDGIGLKTASWITRNWLQSENVAILDIHILRAGKIAGFFDNINVSKNYLHLESQYIQFCNAIEVKPSNMDAIMWSFMKQSNRLALKAVSFTI
ncbi:MAG: 8-oxoguanine DNA glycosylase [Candidatus Pacearchaeota archaeon]